MKCVLEVCLGRVGCAIVLSGRGGLWDVREGLAIRARSCNSPWAVDVKSPLRFFVSLEQI